MYGIYDYPKNLDCYAAFRVPAMAYTQTLKIEVVEGQLSGDSYFAFGNDYGHVTIRTSALFIYWLGRIRA